MRELLKLLDLVLKLIDILIDLLGATSDLFEIRSQNGIEFLDVFVCSSKVL
jgi:hypothetical protein